VTKSFILMLALDGSRMVLNPLKMIEKAKRSRSKGVSLIHFRVTTPEGKLAWDLEPYREASAWLRESSDLMLEFPCWGTIDQSLEERVSPIVLRPNLVEIVPGSVNLGDKVVYNPKDYIKFVLQAVTEASITVDFKILCPSMLFYVRKLIDNAEVEPPYVFTLTFSDDLFPATFENLFYIYKFIPRNSTWFLSVSKKVPRALWAVALELGGNIRVGEDIEEDDEELADERLIEEVLKIGFSLGFEPATPKEAYKVLKGEM